MLSYIHATSGDLAAAEQLLDEIRAASEATGTPAQPYLPLWIAAVRGREAETRDLVQTTSERGGDARRGVRDFVIEHVTAVLYNGLGRYGEALSALRRQAIDPSYRDSSPRPMAELIEAAVRSGERDLARLALDRLEETTSAAGTDWALGIEARSRALLSDGDAADGALSRGDRTAFTHQHPRAARPRPPALRRVAAARAPPPRRARAATHRARDVHEHGHRRVRGPKPARAGGDRRTRAQAHCRDPRRPHSPRGADRATGAPTASRTPKSARGSSSAKAPSPTTCATCSPSSTSPRATNSHRPCPTAQVPSRRHPGSWAPPPSPRGVSDEVPHRGRRWSALPTRGAGQGRGQH